MRTAITVGAITLARTPSGTIHLTTKSGMELWLRPSEAADLLGALNGLPDVAKAWLHGGGR